MTMLSPPPLSSRDSHSGMWFPYRSAGDFDSNLATILIILLCALLSVLALNASIRCFLRRRRRRSNPDQIPQNRPSKPDPTLPEVEIPTLVFSAATKLAGAEGAEAECAICLSEFVCGEKVRILPKCEHGFHEKCVEGWLSSRSSCPTCRSSCLEKGSGGAGGEAPVEEMAEP